MVEDWADLRRLIFICFLAPFTYSLIASILKGKFRPHEKTWDLVGGIGWDLLMIGLGATAGYFSDALVKRRLGDDVTLWAIGNIAFDFLLMLVILKLLEKHVGPLRGTMAIAVGFCSVAVPVALVWS